jgi:hypothetical protein
MNDIIRRLIPSCCNYWFFCLSEIDEIDSDDNMPQSRRRNDTTEVGDRGELLVKNLLENRFFEVEMLRRNYPTYDLIARKNGTEVWVSVKTCRDKKRNLRIGKTNILEKLRDEDVMICLLPSEKGVDIDLDGDNYELWIVPGNIARKEGIAIHEHYHKETPIDHPSRNNPVMVKDKLDNTNGRSIAGAAFYRWAEKYKDNWNHLEKLTNDDV